MKTVFLITLLILTSLNIGYEKTLGHEETSSHDEKVFTAQLNYGYILQVKVHPYKPPNMPSDLTLNFMVSLMLNNKTVEHITYSANITDKTGKVLKEIKEVHSHHGMLEFNYTFPSKDKYYLIVEVVSIGMENPIRNVGKASFTLYIGIPEETATTIQTTQAETSTVIIPYELLYIIIAAVVALAVVVAVLFLVKKK
jgi:hypothetical protein